jgi:SAM-dependent methyltransferase
VSKVVGLQDDQAAGNSSRNPEGKTLLEFFRAAPALFPTDKDTTHSYLEHFYSPLFEQLPEKPVILEIGVAFGGSIRLFSAFRPKGYVVGVDITMAMLHFPTTGSNYEILQADAYREETVRALSNRRYDLIIDDGPHTPETQAFALKRYYPLLREGCVLVIEDVQSAAIAESLCANAPGTEVLDLAQVKGRYDDRLVIRRASL